MDKSAHNLYLSRLAAEGFVVASVEYRTSNEGKYPAQIQDVTRGRFTNIPSVARSFNWSSSDISFNLSFNPISL